MRTTPHQLRTKVTSQEILNHNIYFFKSKIIECNSQIDFYRDILNNPKANIEIQRTMLFNIEVEELAILRYEEKIKKIKP